MIVTLLTLLDLRSENGIDNTPCIPAWSLPIHSFIVLFIYSLYPHSHLVTLIIGYHSNEVYEVLLFTCIVMKCIYLYAHGIFIYINIKCHRLHDVF